MFLFKTVLSYIFKCKCVQILLLLCILYWTKIKGIGRALIWVKKVNMSFGSCADRDQHSYQSSYLPFLLIMWLHLHSLSMHIQIKLMILQPYKSQSLDFLHMEVLVELFLWFQNCLLSPCIGSWRCLRVSYTHVFCWEFGICSSTKDPQCCFKSHSACWKWRFVFVCFLFFGYLVSCKILLLLINIVIKNFKRILRVKNIVKNMVRDFEALPVTNINDSNNNNLHIFILPWVVT